MTSKCLYFNEGKFKTKIILAYKLLLKLILVMKSFYSQLLKVNVQAYNKKF